MSANDNETIDKNELLTKISSYEEQLKSINELLNNEPNNKQYIQLKDDLNKLINLTNNLISNADDNDDLDNQLDDQLDNQLDEHEIVNYLPEKTGSIVIGENIIVYSGERPYAAVFLGMESSNDNQNDEVDLQCKVKYYEFEQEVVIPFITIQRIPPGVFKTEDLTIGLKCQCKYSADQKFYNAEVTGLTKYGVIVKYLEYGNIEEAPIEYLQPLKQKKVNKSNNQNEKGLIDISDKLKILPTDTEEEKSRKKKRLKAIKNHNRLVMKEQELKEAQQSWQSFINKGTKRSFSGINKKSIFTTREEENKNKIQLEITNKKRNINRFQKE